MDKNPQDIPPTFLRKLPDGKTERVDANGKPVAASKTASASEGDSDKASAPTLRTGDLPGNFVAVGALKAGGISTFEALREKDAAALVELGLTEEQAARALEKAHDPLGPAKG